MKEKTINIILTAVLLLSLIPVYYVGQYAHPSVDDYYYGVETSAVWQDTHSAGAVISQSYDLEYGQATIEMHKDSIKPGQKVVLVDDLIATGGTIEAAIKLVEQLGGEVVKVIFLMELAGLKGRERLKGYDVASVITYEGK